MQIGCLNGNTGKTIHLSYKPLPLVNPNIWEQYHFSHDQSSMGTGEQNFFFTKEDGSVIPCFSSLDASNELAMYFQEVERIQGKKRKNTCLVFFSTAERDAFFAYLTREKEVSLTHTSLKKKNLLSVVDPIDNIVWNSVVYEQFIGRSSFKPINELCNLKEPIYSCQKIVVHLRDLFISKKIIPRKHLMFNRWPPSAASLINVPADTVFIPEISTNENAGVTVNDVHLLPFNQPVLIRDQIL